MLLQTHGKPILLVKSYFSIAWMFCVGKSVGGLERAYLLTWKRVLPVVR